MELPDFIQIPKPIMEDRELTQLDWAIYGLIYWYTKLKLQKCILSNESFVALLHVDIRSIKRSLKKLAEHEHIEILYKDTAKRNRLEIIPNIQYMNKKARVTTVSLASDKSVQLEGHLGHHNNIDIIRERNNTVNGEKTLLRKLPDITKDPAYIDYLTQEILASLKDEHSKAFYQLVAMKIPEMKIRETLSEIKTDGAENPAKVFTYRMNRYALQKN